MMLRPGVMLADIIRNPSRVGCKGHYHITEAGHRLTGLPVGHTLYSPTKKLTMRIWRPFSQLVRPIASPMRKNVIMLATVGRHLEIDCEGIAWDMFDSAYWSMSPCQDDKCVRQHIPREGRLKTQRVNTSSVEDVFETITESDFNSTFYCTMASTGVFNRVTVILRDVQKVRTLG